MKYAETGASCDSILTRKDEIIFIKDVQIEDYRKKNRNLKVYLAGLGAIAIVLAIL